jgi:hypothetical protein
MSKNEQKLIKVFKQLNEIDQNSVVSFAEFLSSQSENDPAYKKEPAVLEKPLDIARPEEENVVIAIRRLSATYPMINTSGVLEHAAKLMTEHMLHGKEAKLVIDELELLFLEHYDKYCQTFKTEQQDIESS